MLPGCSRLRRPGIPPSFPAAMLLLLLGAGAALFCLLDAWYLLRLPLAVLHARWLQPRQRDVLQEQSWPGLVLPSDLDWLLHMNNARYLREADLARCAHLARCGIFDALRALGGSLVLAASCARHRRPLRLFERFAVRTRLLGWDARAFYLEQRFVSPRHGFVCALLLCRLHVVGSSPGRLVQHLCRRQDVACQSLAQLHYQLEPPSLGFIILSYDHLLSEIDYSLEGPPVPSEDLPHVSISRGPCERNEHPYGP
ncbi:protein THEM6-like [Emys orbicularis]|uniref:protein THEM6-like n=1 Tax=Emys orbicularis TaxID=82168 RepID=UPI0031FCFD60